MLDTQPTVVSQPVVSPTTVVSLSDAAASKLRELTAEETNPAIGLRVYVYSGGCSGFRYGMMLEDAPTAEDRILEANGVRVYVDWDSTAGLPPISQLSGQLLVTNAAGNLFGTTYYSLVGLHAFHVTVGLIALATVSVFSLLGHVREEHAEPVGVLSLYWHFVDAVWVVVFMVVYVIGR